MNKHLRRNYRRDRRNRVIGRQYNFISNAEMYRKFFDEFAFSDEEINSIIMDAKFRDEESVFICKSKYGKVVSEDQARALSSKGFYVVYHTDDDACYVNLRWRHGSHFEIRG